MSQINFKVLITTSGIGSRLGEFTKFTNKTLLRVGEKPVISHIIESYPISTTFVVTLGYFGDQVRDFLEIAYPDRRFEFIIVDIFQGDKSSLLYSMYCAKDRLQCPFIFHASDTIIIDNIPEPTKNWNGGYNGEGSSSYTSFDIQGEYVKIFHDKGNISPDLLHIGVVGINNYELFWKLAKQVLEEFSFASYLSDVDVLRKFIKFEKLNSHVFNNWFDIGSVEKIQEAKKVFSVKDFHVLDKVSESIFIVNGNIIKFFADEDICKNRVDRTKYLSGIVPEITASRPNYYSYELVKGSLYSKVANLTNFKNFLNWCNDFMWKKLETNKSDSFLISTREFYYDKTLARIKQFQSSREIEDKVEVINGKIVPKLEDLISNIDFDYLCSTEPTTFHGDFILDNIIKVNDHQFKLIDWRQDFGGNIDVGDKYYDLAKLAHNLVVNHQMIDNNQFNFTINEKGDINVDIQRFQFLVECENYYFNYLKENNFDVKKIRILRAIIWLNMSPLHHHPFDLFLYYYGKYSLSLEINNNEI
jgi:NDP-sugar pyrophosphorylase family protein/thiamine kinase-like enzyme